MAGAGHGVVHEGACKELPAVWIIDRMLKESLANALYDPAMNLALEQERVDGAAEIVDDGVALDYDAAGIGFDFDLDNVAAVGEGLSWRHAVMRRIEPGFHARRQFLGIARRLRHAENIEAEIGDGPDEYSIGKTYVLRRDFKNVYSELHSVVDDVASCILEGRSRDVKRTRSDSNT